MAITLLKLKADLHSAEPWSFLYIYDSIIGQYLFIDFKNLY